MDNKTSIWQRRVWRWIGDFVYGIRLLLLYLLLPPAIFAFGLFITGPKEYIEFFLWRSDQFYRTLGPILVLYLMRRKCRRREVSIWDETTLYRRRVNAKKPLLFMRAGAGLDPFMPTAPTVIPSPDFLIGPHYEMTYEVFGKVDKILAIPSAMSLTPLMEEPILRGYVLNRFLRRFESQALVVSFCTGIFAAYYVTPLWVTYRLFTGLLLVHVSVVEGNIIYAVALHMGYNIVMLLVWFASESQQTSMVFLASLTLIGVYGVIGISVAVLCLQQYSLDIRQLAEYSPRIKRKGER